ncbi:MAG: hypothetical protein WCJ29_03750 [bacterium]
MSPSLVQATAVKTVTNFIYSSPTALSGTVNVPYSIYIGDDISAVVNPVKSGWFTSTGLYTGSGTVAYSINGNGASTKTFTLPNVGATPTRFTILYNDPSNTMNPSSSGTYNYTLNIVSSGVSMSGFGVELRLTYEFTLSSCPDGATANEKIKTVENYAYASPTQITGTVTTPVSIYIGEDISGITGPIKSAFFTITGIYTGSGTYAFTLNGDGASTKTFTFPNVGSTPTIFTLKYSDSTGIINPTTSGTYSYSLAMVPSGLTISGLGVLITYTYQHKPPSCGGFPPTGEMESTTFDTTGVSDGPGYNSILWKGALGGPSQNVGHVRFQLAASASSTGPWTYVGGATCTVSDWFEPTGPDTPIELMCPSFYNNLRYFRYKVQLCSSDCTAVGLFTPQVDDVVVSWSP